MCHDMNMGVALIYLLSQSSKPMATDSTCRADMTCLHTTGSNQETCQDPASMSLAYRSFARFLKFPGNAAMDRQGLSSGWVPPARRTRYRYANLPSGPAIDSNRNMRCAAPDR